VICGAGELFVQPKLPHLKIILDCFEYAKHANQAATAQRMETL
jgi:hypothetical protein